MENVRVFTQSHTATLSAIHDAWEQLLKSRGLDFVEGPAAIVEAEGEAYLISWKVKGQRPYWLIVTYAMTGGLHQGVTRFGIDGHGFEFSIRVPAKNKERSPSDKVCAMLTNLIGTARRAPEHVHSGFAVVNGVKRANGRHLADLVLLLCDDRDLPEVQTPNGRVAFLAAQFITREELELCMKGNPDYFSAVLWEKTTPHGLSNFSRKPIITPQIEAACIEADESGLKDATDFQGDFEITRDAQGRTVLELGESGFEHFRRMLCKVLFLREEFTLRHENSVVKLNNLATEVGGFRFSRGFSPRGCPRFAVTPTTKSLLTQPLYGKGRNPPPSEPPELALGDPFSGLNDYDTGVKPGCYSG